MKSPSLLLQALCLPLVLWAGPVVYGLMGMLAGQLMPLPAGGDLTTAVLVSRGFLAATLMAAACSHPLARLYGRRAVVVAALMALPVLILELPGLVEPGRAPLAIFLSAWDVLVFTVLLVGGTWIARNRSAA